jgi:hypothetical protein
MAADPRLARTLDIVAEAAALLQQGWWIIGSAAAFLAGLEEPVADVDLLTSEADARRLLAAWGAEPQPPSPSPLFASTVFARVALAPLPIEVMAGTRVRGEPLVPRTAAEVPWGDRRLYIPEIGEQIAILRRFGRDKDIRRAERLEALL